MGGGKAGVEASGKKQEENEAITRTKTKLKEKRGSGSGQETLREAKDTNVRCRLKERLERKWRERQEFKGKPTYAPSELPGAIKTVRCSKYFKM